MLYTRKGDNGTTGTFGCNQRISKSSSVAEALGALDECNSFLGVIRARTSDLSFELHEKINPHTKNSVRVNSAELMLEVQQNLFIVQAEVAGTDMGISEEKVKRVEEIVDAIEKILPPITTFFISGATELGALFDFARTLSRRAERRVIAVHEEGKVKVSTGTLAYLNRLSSLMYALARITSHVQGQEEVKPSYE